MLIKKYFLSRIILLIFLLLLFLSVSLEEYYSSWTITNKTNYFIHVLVNDQSFLYVSTDKTITAEVETSEVKITAFYSPGQGISGKWSKTYTIQPNGASSGCICPTAPDHDYGFNITPEDLQ